MTKCVLKLNLWQTYVHCFIIFFFFQIDFDECLSTRFHDCSDDSYCFNLRGTYTCSCRDGFADLSENPIYPGRICSAELIGCEKCNYHGTCYDRNNDNDVIGIDINGKNDEICECFQWYAGQFCQYNLKGNKLLKKKKIPI